MAGIFKASLRMALSAIIGLVIAFVATKNIEEMYSVPTYEEITALDNNSSVLIEGNQDKVIERSRSSALRILSLSIENGSIASSSGTYVEMFDRYYVITTSHGILGACESIRILADNTSYDCVRYIEVNNETDYALIEVGKIDNRKPIRVPQQVARTKKEWEDSLAIMARTYYTGFPNGLGPLTIDGKIMGYSPDGFIYMNSYAWSGSSGSGVFSESGDYIGYVLAIDVGPAFDGPAIIENVVLVVPAYKINWASAQEFLQNEPEEEELPIYNNTNTDEETGYVE